MEKKLLYNPFGDDSVSSRSIIKGNVTNLINLNNTKYNWAKDMFRVMTGNFWLPEKVDLSQDLVDYEYLSEDERRCYDGILSFLVFLDSIQTANLPNIGEYITAPEVSILITIQDFQEVIHSQSYAYIIETIIPKERKNSIYEFWRDDKTLYDRNDYVANLYQGFLNDPSDANFWTVLNANYLLEGLYFYNGFSFFYNLASRNKCIGTSDMIRYINRDEYSHCILFERIISEIRKEFPQIVSNDKTIELFKEAVEQEISWTNHIVGKNILGITPASTEAYTKYLANKRLAAIGMDPLYPGFSDNPYSHLELIADEGGEGHVKPNFFESTVTSYNQSSTLDGWDDL